MSADDVPEAMDLAESLREVFPDVRPFQFLWAQAEAPTGEQFLALITYHAAGETTLFLGVDDGFARTFFQHGLDALDRITASRGKGLYLPGDEG